MILCVRAEKLALRCPICRCREGHGRGERAVALDQFFQFSHIAAEVALPHEKSAFVLFTQPTLLHQKSYPAVRYPKAIPLANLTELVSFSWKSLLESVHS